MIGYEIKEQWLSYRGSFVPLLELKATPSPTHLPALLFLHGRFGQGECWLAIFRELADRFRCFAITLPGFGRSVMGRRDPFSLTDHASLVQEVIERWIVPQNGIILVGHDFGGAVAQLCATRMSGISGLVLLNSLCLTQAPTEINTAWWGWRARRTLTRLLKVASSIRDEESEVLRIPWKVKHLRKAMLDSYEEIVRSWPMHYERQVWKKEFQRARVPVLLLWGENDSLNPPDMGVELIRCYSDAFLFIHEQSGHWPNLENPSWVAAKMKDFLFKIESPAQFKPARKFL